MADEYTHIYSALELTKAQTSLIRRFCYEDFLRQYTPTTGADFYIKRLILPTANAGIKQEVVIKLTDIGGKERNAQMLDKYLFKADMIVLVYDITNTESFENMCNWIDTIAALITSPPLSAVIGNKSDLEHQRAVRLDRTRQFIKEHGFYNFLTSAKTGEATNACIIELIAKFIGVPLASLQKEENPVLKVELPTGDKVAEAVARRRAQMQQAKTTVCIIQ